MGAIQSNKKLRTLLSVVVDLGLVGVGDGANNTEEAMMKFAEK